MSDILNTTSIKNFTSLTAMTVDQYLLGVNSITVGDGSKITLANFIASMISSNAGNTLEVGDDSKLFATGGLPDQTGEEGKVLITDGTQARWGDIKVSKGEIGDIGCNPFGIDETENLRRYLNGQVIQQSQFSAFTTRLKAVVQTYSSLACSEAEWQSIASASVGGQCGKFVIDEENSTIRLPKIIMPIQGLTNLSNLGEIVEAGLPNITGSFYAAWRNSNTSGAFRGSTVYAGFQGLDNNSGSYYTFDASRSSDIYGNSDTVQQEQIQYPYFIQVATGVEDTVIIENEYQLNNPYSLLESKYSQNHIYNASWLLSNGQWNSSTTYVKVWQALQVEANSEIAEGTTVTLPSGASYTKQGLSVKASTDSSATDYDFKINNSTNQFKLPTKTNLAGGKAVVGNGLALGLKLGNGDSSYAGYYNEEGDYHIVGADSNNLVSSGATITYPSLNGDNFAGATGSWGIATDPIKSGIETSDSNLYLYFYVGDVIENGNLINAGQAMAEIAEIKGFPHIIDYWEQGTEGYIVYSNGYCEQWGFASTTGTISLLKEYKDINYNVQVSTKETGGGSGLPCSNYSNQTTNSFFVRLDYVTANRNAGAPWRTLGYLAEGEY